MAESSIRSAYRAGTQAYHAGAHWDDCPYPAGAEREAWHRGWGEARFEHVESGGAAEEEARLDAEA